MHILINILPIVQIIIAVVLITIILLQQRGQGLSGIFGGEGGSFHKKRGFEKILFRSTVVFGILFALTALIALVL